MSEPTVPPEEQLTVTPRGFARVIFGILVSLLFALAYTQAPLYYSNQNQYFLHGLAQSGLGNLKQDWLANTADPTPVFSALLSVYKFPDYAYMWQVVFLVCYVGAIGRIFRFLTWGKAPRLALIIFVSLLTVLHCGLVRWLSVQLFGVDYPWYFQSGFAAQYILGFGLQPSVAGVFLVASIVSFLWNHPY